MLKQIANELRVDRALGPCRQLIVHIKLCGQSNARGFLHSGFASRGARESREVGRSARSAFFKNQRLLAGFGQRVGSQQTRRATTCYNRVGFHFLRLVVRIIVLIYLGARLGKICSS